jgi:Fe(3+) dicitrate transport protein
MTKVYANYFNRRWWRENDVFVKAYSDGTLGTTPVSWYEPGNLARVGDGKSNFGILRKFVTLGVEQSYTYDYKVLGKKANLEAGARGHYEKFFDVRVVGDAPDAREGILYTQDANGVYDIVGTNQNFMTTALSLFAQNKIALNNKLTVIPGMRVEAFEQERIDLLKGARYEDQSMIVLLPGFGFNWEGNPSFNLFGGVHRGFTPPSSGTLNVMAFGQSQTGFDLKSEKSWNTEVGFRASTPWMALEMAAFYVPIRDLVAAGRGTVFKNLGKVNNTGVENSAKLFLSDRFKALPDINVSYTFLHTEIMDGAIQSAVKAGTEVSIAGNSLPYAPTHTLTVGLSKEMKFGLSLRADMRYVSKAYTDFENIEKTYNRGDTGPIPAYHLFNASVFYSLNKHWKAFIVGKNLADKVYIGSRLHSNPGQPEAHLSSGIMPGSRRQINVGLKYSFGAD